MGTLPTGTVTFLFTDIEGSTKLAQQYPEDISSLLARHNEILDQAIQARDGFVFRTIGDAYCVAFHSASDALNAALDAQRQLHKEAWEPAPIKVRIGIHTGAAQLEDESSVGSRYSGYTTLALTQRIMSAGNGGQVLLSQTVHDLLSDNLPPEAQLIDMGERHLKDILRPERLFQLFTSDLPSEFPALKTIAIINHNLPVGLTSFIGRERELAEADEKLKGARLLTLIGPGGTGKTRLSIQLGTDLLPSFKDGVWLVELAPVSDPSLVVQTIASVLNVRELPGVPLKNLVLDYFRMKQLLLILDNCEHLIETCAQIADEFLHNAPNMKLIASSREALGINGETVYRVPSLSLPGQVEVTREAAMGFESVQLFVDRASAVNPKFKLTDENASLVAQICHRLDGIPLAIELSASRVTVFSPEQIAKRLDDRFKLLTGGSRTALPRQQTLRALIDWSYDLLSEPERALLRRLSVFAGGWTFEALEAVCNEMDVLDLLPQLVNKSLVVVDDVKDESRYHLLETIRQYARDKLLENGEGEGTRNRHLDYYLALAEITESKMFTSLDLEWIHRIETELDNLRTALEWGLSNDIEAALRMAGSLTYFWLTRSHEIEGHRWASEALKRARLLSGHDKDLTSGQIMNRAKALTTLVIMSYSQGQNIAARDAANEAVALWRQIGENRYLAIVLSYLASANVFLGNNTDALAARDEALELARKSGDKFVLGSTLSLTGQVVAMVQGDFNAARAYGEEAIALLKQNGNHWSVAITIHGLGLMAKSFGNFEEARSRFNSAMPFMLEIGDKHRVNMIKSELAHVERYEGHYERAIPLYRETLLEWQRLGHRAAIAHQLESVAFVVKALGYTEKAIHLFGAAEALREVIDATMTPQERREYEHEVADLKANTGEREFASLWAEGRSMTLDEAIGLASGEQE